MADYQRNALAQGGPAAPMQVAGNALANQGGRKKSYAEIQAEIAAEQDMARRMRAERQKAEREGAAFQAPAAPMTNEERARAGYEALGRTMDMMRSPDASGQPEMQRGSSLWDMINPVGTANAGELPQEYWGNSADTGPARPSMGSGPVIPGSSTDERSPMDERSQAAYQAEQALLNADRSAMDPRRQQQYQSNPEALAAAATTRGDAEARRAAAYQAALATLIRGQPGSR